MTNPEQNFTPQNKYENPDIKYIREQQELRNKNWADGTVHLNEENKDITYKEAYEREVEISQSRHERMRGVLSECLPEGKHLVLIDLTDEGVAGRVNMAYIKEDRKKLAMKAQTGREAVDWKEYQSATIKYALGVEWYENTLKTYRAFEAGRFTNGFPKDLTDCAGVIFSGSEANIHEEENKEYAKMSEEVIKFIRLVRSRGIPMFGLCFGSQALNHSFGSKVDWIDNDNHDSGEVGAVKLSLTPEGKQSEIFKEFTEEQKDNLYINASHAQHVKKESIPEELVVLASSDTSEVHITGLKSDHSILSIQGHPETTDAWVDMASDTGQNPGKFHDPNLFQGLTLPLSEALFKKFLYMVKDTAEKNKTA